MQNWQSSLPTEHGQNRNLKSLYQHQLYFRSYVSISTISRSKNCKEPANLSVTVYCINDSLSSILISYVCWEICATFWRTYCDPICKQVWWRHDVRPPAWWAHGLLWWHRTAITNVVSCLVKRLYLFLYCLSEIKFTTTTTTTTVY